MPMFTRRRLQVMVDDIAAIHPDKARDLVGRLQAKYVEQVLPAEMELSLLWALSRTGEVEIEPELGSSRPEAYAAGLVAGRRSIVEITAPTDNSISGEAAMDRVAQEVSACANQVKKGLGSYLYFRFAQESGYSTGQYFRRRLVPDQYRLSDVARRLVSDWIASGRCTSERLRIVEPGLDVDIEKSAYKQVRYHNTWCAMPPEAYGVDTNPLWDALERKLDQIRAPDADTLRFIFLADGGSTLLNRLGTIGEVDHLGRRTSATEIISTFLDRYQARVDAVVVFAPTRRRHLMGRDELIWRVTLFQRPSLSFDTEGLERVAAALPRPRFEGYQVRSLFRQGDHRQGLYDAQALGAYMGMSLSMGMHMDGEVKVKVSARAVLDLLAGRLSPERFAREVSLREGQLNVFEHWLRQGKTLSAIEVESGGPDQDDDAIVLTMRDDPAARALRGPAKPRKAAKLGDG